MNAHRTSRPALEDWRRLASEFNGVDLAKRLGVPTGTVSRWGRHYGIMPLFRCRRCKLSKDRSEFATDKICRDCDNKYAVESAHEFRVCNVCERRKPLTHHNWYRTGKGKRLWDGTCKLCRKNYFSRRAKRLWSEHKAEMEASKVIRLSGPAEWAAKPIARPADWIEEINNPGPGGSVRAGSSLPRERAGTREARA